MRVVIPHIADQFFWAKTVHDLGVGPQPMPRARLSTTALATSLQEVVHNDSLSAAASSLGEQIRAERGIDNAVRQIEEEFL
jgi:sterol 3beta-glucosyltransferase